MKTKCIHNDLIFYLDNELSVEKKSAVEKHLEECADCRSFLAFLMDELQVIEKEKKQEASPFFYTRLSARLGKQSQFKPQGLWVRIVQPAFFLIILIAGIYGGLRLGVNATSGINNPESTSTIQLMDDFAAEPIESFLLDEL